MAGQAGGRVVGIGGALLVGCLRSLEVWGLIGILVLCVLLLTVLRLIGRGVHEVATLRLSSISILSLSLGGVFGSDLATLSWEDWLGKGRGRGWEDASVVGCIVAAVEDTSASSAEVQTKTIRIHLG